MVAQLVFLVTTSSGLLELNKKTGTWPAAFLLSSYPLQVMGISLEQAQAAIQAAHQKSLDLGVKMNIAIVDAGANLVAFARMDDAWLGSLDISIKKAKTSRFFDMPTGALGQASQPGGPLFNIEVSNGGLITFPGGLPIKDGSGKVIGAIGVSGDSVENDHTVAEAGVNAVAGK
jgi:uncharacterized protein GlcG (DUF336 family)